jgi:hypothetical protein
MNSETGMWIDELTEKLDPKAWQHKSMNQYSIGQVVECNGDFWEVESIVSKPDGGRLTLRGLSEVERGKLTDQLTTNLTGEPIRNRGERRKADRKLRRLLDLNVKRSCT